MLLILQCHFSYSACGLASNGTDRLVNLVQEMQHSKSSESEGGTLFGAKITGGGSGGTVCVIGRNCLRSNEQLVEVDTSLCLCSYAIHVFSVLVARSSHCRVSICRFSKDTKLPLDSHHMCLKVLRLELQNSAISKYAF